MLLGALLLPPGVPWWRAVFHRLLYLLEGAPLDLTHALARDTKFGSEILERIGSSASRRASKMRRSRSLSTSSAAIKRLMAVIAFLMLGQDALLAGRVVDQPIHAIRRYRRRRGSAR